MPDNDFDNLMASREIKHRLESIETTPWSCPSIDIVQTTIKKFARNREVMDIYTANMLVRLLEDVRDISHHNRQGKEHLGRILAIKLDGHDFKFTKRDKTKIRIATHDERVKGSFVRFSSSMKLEGIKDFEEFKTELREFRLKYKPRVKRGK
jgi:hypothetical protein